MLDGARATARMALDHPRIAAAVVAVLLIASVLVVYRPSLVPPALHSRSLEVAAASTTLLVSGPDHAAISSYSYEVQDNQSLLAGNVLLSPAVIGRVARALRIAPRAIAGYPPVTANVPAVLVAPGSSGGPTDILVPPAHYRIEVQVDPVVPEIRLFTQAPSTRAAEALANLAARDLSSYVSSSQSRATIPNGQRISVRQLGGATGGSGPSSGPAQMVLLLFVTMLLLALVLTAPALRLLAPVGRGLSIVRPNAGPARLGVARPRRQHPGA